MGVATRIYGQKTQRIYHLFSNTQLYYYYLLEWENDVVDIREHYPLLDLEEIITSTEDLKLNKFMDKETKIPYILTTTFLITTINKDHNLKYTARSVKYASELNKKITLEKLEIERRYWQEGLGIDWGVITNKDINMVKAKNIEWILSNQIANETNEEMNEKIHELSRGLLWRLKEVKNNTIRNCLKSYEQDYDLQNGEGISLLKNLLADKVICVDIDMDKPVNLNKQISDLKFNEKGRAG